MNKEITLICCINNLLEVNDFVVKVYDNSGKKISTNLTKVNRLKLNLNDEIYKIEVLSNKNNIIPNRVVKTIDVNDLNIDKVYINFIDLNSIKTKITIILTDENYPGLIIEKGIIVL